MKEILKIDNLTVSFGDRRSGRKAGRSITALHGVDLHVGRGETLALVGGSGCGKTVLCKSMLGFLCGRGSIDGGSIRFMDEELADLGENELAAYRGGGIAMIPQDPMTSLDPMVSVGDQIAETIIIAERRNRSSNVRPANEDVDPRRRAIEIMRQVGIEDAKARYDQRPYQFSGGMRQRIVIGIALAGDPELVLADEPTTALDEQIQADVLSLLKEQQKQTGFGMIFITHDLHLVKDMAERVAIMKDGRIVEEGLTEDVFRDPSHDHTRRLLGYLDYYRNEGHRHRAGDTEGTQPEGRRDTQPEDLSDPVLSVRGLNKSYGDLKVLQDLDLDAGRGEILGIVGRSGCGKSTLAACIMGIEPYDSGKITIRGGREKAQMIFQGTQDAFNRRMSIGEIIAEPVVIRKGRRSCDMDRVMELMDEVGLERSLIDRRPNELSGGQVQRAAIARALISDPDLIVADEPLTGLDVTAQAKIVHLLRKLVDERNLSLILIAHDRPMVEHVSDRVIFFQ